jgi:hypothetical protein
MKWNRLSAVMAALVAGATKTVDDRGQADHDTEQLAALEKTIAYSVPRRRSVQLMMRA